MADIRSRVSLYLTRRKLNGDSVIDYIDSKPQPKFENLNTDSSDRIRVTTVAIKSRGYSDYYSYIDSLCEYIENSLQSGSRLITLPQYIGLIPIGCTAVGKDTLKLMNFLVTDEAKQEFLIDRVRFLGDWLMNIYVNTYHSLAKKYQVNIHGGSIPVYDKGKVYNRSYIFSKEGDIVMAQDKTQLLPEEEQWGFSAGVEFNTAQLDIGTVAILSDIEWMYYENFKICRGQGARLILTSSITTDRKLCSILAEALSWRAGEQAVYVLQSSYVDIDGDSNCRVICPNLTGKNVDGVYIKTSREGDHTCTLKYSKLSETFDRYTADSNTEFYSKVLRDIYKN